MQISVTFRHIEPSAPLKDYAQDKISRVKKYLEEPIEAHVVLKVEKFRHIAEATIDANGLVINGTEETEDMYSAIDMLADTVEGQGQKDEREEPATETGGFREGSGSRRTAPGRRGP